MKGRSLALIFFASMSFVTLFVFITYPNFMSSPDSKGARGAYFTQVEYPAVAYEGKDSVWNLTIYNKNCTTNGEGNASFFFKFYLDGDPWWNEYNNTDYKTWQCNKGNLVTRLYTISTWNTMKPVNHELKIELYCYNGSISQLQDAASLPVSVAIHTEPSNLIISSYITVYLIPIFLLGFYMFITGVIKISSAPPDDPFVFDQQSSRMRISPLPKVRRQLFLCFYLFVFASWQMINVIVYAFFLQEQVQLSVYLTAQIAYIILLGLLMRREGSSFRRYGYSWPEETRKYMTISLLLAVLYSFITIITPGISTGFDVFPSPSLTEVFLPVLLALVSSFTSETVFRGYIQSKLTKIGGFPLALLITSIMFALYELTLFPFNLFRFLFEILSFLILGIFLGILFYRTKTLLCPIIFYFTILTLRLLIPIKAITSEYAELFFNFVALALSLILLIISTVKEE